MTSNQRVTDHSASDAVLARLEHVLRQERIALTELDVGALEQAAADKLELRQELQRILERGDRPSAAKLARLRARLIQNQMLMVHARDTARGVIQIATGAAPSYGPTGGWRMGGAARIDARL